MSFSVYYLKNPDGFEAKLVRAGFIKGLIFVGMGNSASCDGEVQIHAVHRITDHHLEPWYTWQKTRPDKPEEVSYSKSRS